VNSPSLRATSSRPIPNSTKLFGEKEFTWNKIRQPNRNPLLTSLEGADGLKTGYTKDGGYGMVGSAVQNGIRLIVVVNGLEDPEDRASEAKKMLEWGFRNFEARTLFAAQQRSAMPRYSVATAVRSKLASPEPIKVMVQKNGTDKLIARLVYNGPVQAPIEPGQRIGLVKVWRGGQHRRGGTNLCGGIGWHRVDDAPRDRWRKRTCHRNVFARASRSSDHGRGSGQKNFPGADDLSPLRAARDRESPPRSEYWPNVSTRPRYVPSSRASRADRRGLKSFAISCCLAWASCWARTRRHCCFGRARRSCAHRHQAGLEPGSLGAVRPLFGLDARLSGQAGQGRSEIMNAMEAGHDRRSQA